MTDKMDNNEGKCVAGNFLWQKVGHGDDAKKQIDTRIMRLMAGEDILLDRALFLYDIRASKAHSQGLARIGALGQHECEAILGELDRLDEEYVNGKFELDNQFEDGHSAIESVLVQRLGDQGKKVHLGRSRNDQVLVATRLFMKDQLDMLAKCCVRIAQVCVERAKTESLAMPGYTHMQRAVVNSTGMWHSGWAEAFIEDANRAINTRDWIDCNPLGTAAGYGVNVPLDRDFTTAQLGFERLQISPIAAQLSRGKFEMATLEAFCSALLDLRRLAWDLSLFCTAEFDFVQMPPEYTTGSSIMPNKRNPDVVELLRGGYARLSGARNEIEQILSLPSGYQRDLQLTKGPLVRGCRQALEMLEIVPDLLAKMEWIGQKMRCAIEPAMFATDIAVELALAGLPFRDAYRQTAAKLDQINIGGSTPDRTPEQSLAARVSPGSAANPLIERLKTRLDDIKRKCEEVERKK